MGSTRAPHLTFQLRQEPNRAAVVWAPGPNFGFHLHGVLLRQGRSVPIARRSASPLLATDTPPPHQQLVAELLTGHSVREVYCVLRDANLNAKPLLKPIE